MTIIMKPRVAIVGSTGAVGTTLLSILQERDFPFSELHLIASDRSAGKLIRFMDKSYTVKELSTFDFSRTDLAFFTAGTDISEKYIPKALNDNVLIIDNSNAYRMDINTPLIVPQVNSHLIKNLPRPSVIANPNCVTIPITRAFKSIHHKFKLTKMIVNTYQAASGAGHLAVEDLKSDSQNVLHKQSSLNSDHFVVPLAFNVIPHIDIMLDTGFTLEELKIRQEVRKILACPTLSISATAVRVPVINSHSSSVYFECENVLDQEQLIKLLSFESEIEVSPSIREITPRFIKNKDLISIGRIRIDEDNPNAGWLWNVSDNLRVGAALNAVQIGEIVLKNKII